MIYEFKCDKCGNVQDELRHKFVKVGTKGSKCEKCGGVTHRIFSAPNLRFQWARGRGFYATNSNEFDK
jgi:putative FmdB family regulatory protein